jgi:phosphoribosylpyrophosphate synthetase
MRAQGGRTDDAELHYAYYIADLLREVGRVDKFAVMDPHDLVSVEAIRRPHVTLTALHQIATTLRSKGMIPVNAGVVIADDGAIGRSHFFADAAGIPVVGRIEKARRGGVVYVERIHSIGLHGFKNRTIFLVDDMIATGGTLFKDALALKKMGAKTVIGVVTHVKGVRDTEIHVKNELLAHTGLDELVITNTTPYHHQLGGVPGVTLVDVLHILKNAAQVFLSPNFLLTDGSVSGIEAIKKHVFHMDTIDGYKRRLSLQYPELVPEL